MGAVVLVAYIEMSIFQRLHWLVSLWRRSSLLGNQYEFVKGHGWFELLPLRPIER